MLNILFSIITSRLTWSFLGVAAISFAIWFIGPIITIGNVIPFKSHTVQIITIIAFFFIWLLSQVIPRLYRSWLNQKLTKQLNITKDENTDNKQNERYITLTERFSDATKLLRKAYFSGLYSKNKPGWINFLNRQYIYQLPWYLVVGIPNSGKTTALANSGLHFPLSDYSGKSVLYSRQSMDNCHWWFTNKAVLLDIAGRYITQDNLHQQDADEWKDFIRLLKKYRRRQPLNGIIITISVEDLLNSSTENRDQQAYMLRKRLSELHEQLKIRLPIYIMVTKTDLLKGFGAYFTHFDKKNREQIWGFNFPWDNFPWNKWNKYFDFNLHETFEQQYNQLQLRLEAELPSILLNGHHSRQRAESYLFPQEFSSLRPLIAQYLEIIFAKSGFEIPYYPRGLYFTSGTQGGISFDNVMYKFNHHFQLPTDNNSDAMSWGDNKGMVPPTPPPQTYFLKNLLENIFQEAGIAGYNRWWIYRKRFFRGLGYIASIAILVLVINLLLRSYNNNKNYLMEVQRKIPNIVQQGDKLKKNANDIYALLPILNSLAHLDKSQHFSVNDPPLSYQMGLFYGEQISDASRSLYKKALRILLLPQITTIITNQMHDNNNYDSDIEETHYNTLKAYQMLYQPKYYDGQFLHNWVMQYLKTHLKADTTQQQLQQIEEHISQLLDNQIVTSPFIRDDALIEKKQIVISSTPPAQRAYHYLKEKLIHDPNLTPVNLNTLAGPQAELVFSHISDSPITNEIPGMFTPTGYQQSIDKNLNTFLTTMYSQDNWVLGTYAKKQTDQEIKSLVKQFYINDYIYQWNQFLADIRLRNIDNLEQRTNTARLLSSFDSPMRNLLINIRKNVVLNEDNIKVKQLNTIVKNQSANLTKSLPKQITKQIGSDNDQPTPEQELEAHFAQLIKLAKRTDKDSESIPFDKTLGEISELYLYLTSVKNAINTGMPLPPSKIITQLQATSELLPVPFGNMVSSLAVGASNDTQLSDMRNVSKHFNAEIGNFCYQAIANRYPLMPDAKQDIKPDDMARMFAPQIGLMDSFFQKNLVDKVDTTLPRWQFMPGVNGKPLPGGKALLKPFQQAQIIRDTLFTNGTPTPLFHVMVRPISMDNDILSMILDVDGQKLTYSYGPPLSQLMNWPGPAKTNRVRIQLNLSDGTTANLSTSGFWALNRLLDKAKRNWHGKKENPTYADDTDLQARFNISGHTVLLEFIPNSVFSPFNLPAFSCPNPERFYH